MGRNEAELQAILGNVSSYVFVVAAAGLALGLIAIVFFRRPRTDRNWLPGLDRVATFEERTANKVVVRNLRDWTFDQNGPVQKDWRDVLIDPETAASVWYFVDLFPRSDLFAHTFASFKVCGENGIEYLTLSIEIRKTVGQKYSPIRGLLNAYELIYLWSTERDVLGLRATAHGKQVYGYKVNLTSDQVKKVFQAFIKETKELAAKPRFYNTLASNCTSLLAHAVNRIGKTRIPFHYSYVLTGYADRYLHRLGFLGDGKQDFATIRAEAYLTEIIQSVSGCDAATFSRRIREAIRSHA